MATSKDEYRNFMRNDTKAKTAQEVLNNTRQAAYNATYDRWLKENPLAAEIIGLVTPNGGIPIYSQMQDAQSITNILDILGKKLGLDKARAEEILNSTDGLVNIGY